jgi:endosialidase-like protein
MRHERGRQGCVWLGIVGLLVGSVWLLGGARSAAGAGGEAVFVGLTPCRLVDTRGNGFGGAFGPPSLAAGVPRDFPLQGQCGIPATAAAVSLNVTATNTQGPGFLLLHPQSGAQPLVSTLNYVAAETVANAALVPLGPGGLTVVAGVAGTDLILDVDGYFTDSLVHAVDAQNLFVGVGAGNLATTGAENTVVGNGALAAVTNGSSNTAVGLTALPNNDSGDGNTAVGRNALFSNTSGTFNTAVGQSALFTNNTGRSNTAVGHFAGQDLISGDFNIYLAARAGLPTESRTMRLGDFVSSTFVAGINGSSVDQNVPVLVGSDGKLGTVPPSSRRFKTDIADLGDASRGLLRLRPVSFRYRAHPPDGPVDYGLIAEEVAEVYPELVVRDAEGAPETVRYHLLPALLLNELQRQARATASSDAELQTELQAARAELAELKGTVAELVAEMARLKGRFPVAVERHDRNR